MQSLSAGGMYLNELISLNPFLATGVLSKKHSWSVSLDSSYGVGQKPEDVLMSKVLCPVRTGLHFSLLSCLYVVFASSMALTLPCCLNLTLL